MERHNICSYVYLRTFKNDGFYSRVAHTVAPQDDKKPIIFKYLIKYETIRICIYALVQALHTEQYS